jgi:exonuclease III
VIIYGAAQAVGKEEFLREFSQVCQQRKLPTVYGGDFNLIRHAGGKSTPGGMSKWNTIFNIIIENNNLMDINLCNRKYTWCNDHVFPTYAKLDRFLVSVSWMDKYPLSNVMAMPREMSDHTPLILDVG